MRLLLRSNTGELCLTEYFIDRNDIPPYAILSHAWEHGEEVTFRDLTDGTGKNKTGYNKIQFCGQQAERDGLQYFWVDTCCIDKSSSTELQEAINSMFRWYQNAKRCYVYLSDVISDFPNSNDECLERWKPAFEKSRWFTRGWTLQELIAPESVDFFSKYWAYIGNKKSLEQTIHDITGIPVEALRRRPLSEFRIEERLSWAEKRCTTREEDIAYCLLGIFNIYMPLIYGEGRENALARLEKEVKNISKENFKLSQTIKTGTGAINSNLNFIRTQGDKAEHRRLLEWISSTDYPAQQFDIIKRRQKGTGHWFLHSPQVAKWISEPQATLFCPGILGAGKTMIAAITIDFLLNIVESSSHGVAYVYCNYKAREEQDTSKMLAAILKQLVQARPSLMEPVEWLHQQHAGRGTRPSPDEVFDALRHVVAQYSTVYIVVDALDECQDSDGTRREFLAKLGNLQAGHNVCLMATSRFIPDILDWFSGELKLEVRARHDDVIGFVANQLYRVPKCIRRDPKLQEMVLRTIVEAADGMFLLARLYIDSLYDKFTVKMVKSTLCKLSQDSSALDDVYKNAIQRIEGQPSEHYKLAKKVLSWMMYAKRPLTTTEMCCALAVEPGETELDPENIPDIGDLLSVCAGLVVVEEERAVILLAHYTTREYFERIQEAWNPGARLYIASTCLTYLSFSIFKTGGCSSDKEFEERLQESQFLDYAAKHWGEHTATVEDQIHELACSFLSHDKLVSCAAQVLLHPTDTDWNYSQKYPKDSMGLYLAARFGLSIVSETLLPSQEREVALVLEKRYSYGQTLLYLAAKHGHQRMVKLLLDRGADVNAQGGFYGNALQAASARGHEQVVKLLVGKGANVNAQGGKYGNALQAASEGGHEQVVKLLLDKSADTNVERAKF